MGAILFFALAIPIGFVAVVTGVVASMPLTPESLMPAYMEATKKSPAEGLRYEQLVAVDAVRFRQDFSRVTPETIQETVDFFEHCTVEEDPETGHDVTHCVQRSLDVVMTDLRFSEDDRELVRQLIASLTVRDPEHEGGFVFQPSGPYVWPLDGLYHITSPYGPRTDPVTGEQGFHTGLDVAAPMYTPVRAVATGTVRWVGWDGNYGQKVRLDNGGFLTEYAHLSAIKVHTGQVVAAGEVVGLVGTTGKSTGPHLHFEWWTEKIPVDPVRTFGGG